MLLSLNWLKEYVDFPYSADELDHILTMLGIEVEDVIDPSVKFKNFVTAHVLEKEAHPDADKLSVCKVDYGDGVNTVVCGAPNVDKGQKVVLAIPGAVVPSAGFEIGKRKLRGVESNGMICSKAELEISDDHDGIWVLPESTEIGKPLSDFLEMNDIIFEISITPDRADCLSHIGVARDIAAYADTKLRKPEPEIKETGSVINEGLKITIEDSEKCPRYAARVVRNVEIKESPEWLKNKLNSIGLRPINIAVDATNYVLMESGQPLHAFDYDKVADKHIVVKTVAKGTKFTTLDSKSRTLDDEMLMICDSTEPIAIGGVMGGENSEITDDTRNILIESAYFQPDSIRKTSKKLGIQSDASYRFERGVDPENIIYALNRAAKLIAELGGGQIDKGIVDEYPNKLKQKQCRMNFEKTRKLIGVDISDNDMVDFLDRLNFEVVDRNDTSVFVKIPTYRVDVEIEEDLIEEVARLFNYDNIDPVYSANIDFSGTGVPEQLAVPSVIEELREFFISRGFNEIVTQNQLDPRSSELFSKDLIEISNPLGEELSLMRPSIIPSVLKVIEGNIRLGNKDLALYEIGKSFRKDIESENFIKGIHEKREILIALSGNRDVNRWDIQPRSVDFYDIKGIAEDLFAHLRVEGLRFIESNDENSPYSGNSLIIAVNKKQIGILGEIKTTLLKEFDIEQNVLILELDIDDLESSLPGNARYMKISPYPGIERDLAFVLDNNVSSGKVLDQILNNGGKYLTKCEIFDVYKGKGIPEGKKSIAFNLYFSSPERTLKDKEVDKQTRKLVNHISNTFKAELRQ